MQDTLLQRAVERESRKRAKFIDDTVRKCLPKWKANLLEKYKSKLLAKIINVNIDLEIHQLIAGFGEEIIVKLNGKIIGSRKFKV